MPNLRHNLLVFLLAVLAFSVLAYTFYVGSTHGWDFLSVAIQNATSLTWNGQFMVDFSSYLLLSAIWIAWRNRFSAAGIIIALIAMTFGIIIFAPYLLYLVRKEKGDMKRVLVGAR